MKRLLLVVALGLAVVVGVAGVRAYRLPSRQPPSAETVALPDPAAAAERLAAAIRIETVSRQEPASGDPWAFVELHQLLEASYPRVHGELRREVIGGSSLLFTWPGADPALAPALLMGHLDVVPVPSGTEKDWAHPPFSGRIVDGHVWGRGALDDKGGVIALLEAAEALLGDGFAPRRTLLLAFGHDEEIGGDEGAGRIAELLTSRHGELAMVLDEGSLIIEDVAFAGGRPVAFIGVAEKGYLSLELAVEAAGGHSSLPPSSTAVGTLARAVAAVEERPFPARIDGASRQMLEHVGAELPFARRALMANLWLTAPLVRRILLATPTTAAMVRTTTAPTMLAAGVKENVLPRRARAVVNFRILPGDSAASVTERVRALIDDDRVRVTPLPSASEPSPVSDPDAPAFRLLGRTLRRVEPDPELLIAPFLVVAATDAKHYAGRSANVYRFQPVTLAEEDLARYHGVDERISLDALARAMAFYRELMVGAAAEEL